MIFVPGEPSSGQAEIGLLGFIIHTGAQNWLCENLNAHNFSSIEHYAIFDTIQHLRKLKKPIDRTLFFDDLNSHIKSADNIVSPINRQDFVSIANSPELKDAARKVFAASADKSLQEEYEKRIIESYNSRIMLSAATMLNKSIINDGIKPEESFIEISKFISEHIHKKNDYDLNAIIDTAAEDLKNKLVIPTMLGPLDNLIGGLYRGEIVTFAGRTGHGKSTLVANLVHNLCASGRIVQVFNREMSNSQMVQKLFVLEANGGLSYKSVSHSNLTQEDYDLVDSIKEGMKEKYKNLIMYDSLRTLEESSEKIINDQPDVFIDDYIQLIDTSYYEEIRLKIKKIMLEYKWLAKTGKCSAVIISQLNRDIDKRIDKRPRLSDLSEGGSIETDSAVVVYLYRDWLYNYEESKTGPHGIEFIAQKNRFGVPGSVEMGFYGDKCKLTNRIL